MYYISLFSTITCAISSLSCCINHPFPSPFSPFPQLHVSFHHLFVYNLCLFSQCNLYYVNPPNIILQQKYHVLLVRNYGKRHFTMAASTELPMLSCETLDCYVYILERKS